MTETRTNRHELPQWGAGTDSGSRADFNEAFDKLNDQAAYDDGTEASALPVTGVVVGRYALATFTGGYRTLYRRGDGVWDAIGGNTMPRAFHHRGLEGQARTDTALTFSHPGSANPGATFDYGGSAVLSGTVRVYDDDEATRGVLIVGTSAAADPATLGRVHVRTRAEGERGIVVRPYTPGSGDPIGNLFSAQSAGGSDVFTLDGLSRLRQQAASAFGGAVMPTTSVLAVSPTSSDSDTVTNGLLLYGQAAAGVPAGKTILRIQPDAATDTTPIGLVTRTGISLGRLPWGTPGTSSGTITYAGNTHHFRASGHGDTVSYFTLRRSNPTSPATEADPLQDVSLLAVGNTGITGTLPMSLSQRQYTAPATLTLYRVTNFTGAFLDLARLVPDGGGGETSQVASSWASDGRLATGAWWRSTGTTRDARQPVKHVSRKSYALPTDNETVGQNVDNGSSFTYTWAQMTVRSLTTTDLEVKVTVELVVVPNPASVDTNSILLETLASINGGGYSVIDSSFVTLPLTQTAARLGGTVVTATHRATGVPANATFTLRTRLTVGDSVPDTRLRTLDVVATETIVESYAAP
jgi:hypothetical protein